MSETRDMLERAHQAAARASGLLSGILARGRGLTPDALDEAAADMEMAASMLREAAQRHRGERT